MVYIIKFVLKRRWISSIHTRTVSSIISEIFRKICTSNFEGSFHPCNIDDCWWKRNIFSNNTLMPNYIKIGNSHFDVFPLRGNTEGTLIADSGWTTKTRQRKQPDCKFRAVDESFAGQSRSGHQRVTSLFTLFGSSAVWQSRRTIYPRDTSFPSQVVARQRRTRSTGVSVLPSFVEVRATHAHVHTHT